MDQNLQPKSDIRVFIAYPKDWQREGKHNKPKPRAQYPYQPSIINAKGKLAPIGDVLNPLTFKSAREESEYLKANPEMAEKIAAARALIASPADKLVASNESMAKLAEVHKEVVSERNKLEAEAAELRDQLAAAKAELAAAQNARRGHASPVHDEGAEEESNPTRKRRTKAEMQAARAAGE